MTAFTREFPLGGDATLGGATVVTAAERARANPSGRPPLFEAIAPDVFGALVWKRRETDPTPIEQRAIPE